MCIEKRIQVTISEDKMSAWITLEDINCWSLTGVKEALRNHGVVFEFLTLQFVHAS